MFLEKKENRKGGMMSLTSEEKKKILEEERAKAKETLEKSKETKKVKNPSKKVALMVLLGLVVFIFGVFRVSRDTLSSKKESRGDVNQTSGVDYENVNQAFSVDYEIVEIEDQSRKALGNKSLSDYTGQEIANLPTDKKILYRIVVSSEIKENQVKPTIYKVISKLTEKDNDIDEITLFLYSDKELSEGPYDIGTATWAPFGELGNMTPEIAKNNDRSNYDISYKIKDNLEEYLVQRGKSENRFGLTEKKRRQFFKDIVAAEDRANNEAERLYPIDISNPNYKQENLMKNMDKADKLMEKYRVEVRDKYGVSKGQATKISVEAFEEGWPME